MRKTLAAVALSGAALIAVASPAVADASSGAPNNCLGQVTQYTTRGNDISPFVSANGMGNVADANSVSTKVAMNYLKLVVCGSPA